MSTSTSVQAMRALQLGLRSGEYWMALVEHDPDDFTLYLYPVDAGAPANTEPMAFAPDVQDRDPLAQFTGTWDSVIEQLIAYQVAEKLS